MDNKEWLKELKTGDKVAYDVGYRKAEYSITTVEKITPTGIIKTSDGKTWNSDGRQRGGDKRGWHGTYVLQPYTEQIQDHIARKKALYYIEHSDLDLLPTEVLTNIVNIIGANIAKAKEGGNKDG